MAEAFKNVYSPEFFDRYADVLRQVLPDINKEEFIAAIYIAEWEKLEIKQRMRHITGVLKKHLSDDFKIAVKQLLKSISILISEGETEGVALGRIEYIFMSDYIEIYGIDDFDTSVNAFETITQFTSSEFGVRPFIIKYGQKMLDLMYLWANHKNEKVRRLASEGSRSRLPWGMAIPALKKDPTPLLPILETMKNDPSPYVRKSVANNLNDISKDNPQVVINIVQQWKGKSKETDWILKHACRSLLKEANQEVLDLFGFGSIDAIEISHFELSNDRIHIGQHLEFKFNLHNHSTKDELLRLEYGLYYQKKNGSMSRKVFKISEKIYKAKSVRAITRHQSFRVVTTRQLHPGAHQVSLIINGMEVDVRDFILNR